MTEKKNVVLDATTLSTIMSCPRLADLRFNHNLLSLDGKSSSLEMGSIVHTVVETFYENIIKGFKREDCIANGMLKGEEYSRSDEVNNTTPQDIQYALDTCIQYFDYYASDSWTPLEVEVVKRKVLYEDDDIRILWKAKLDLVVDTHQGIYPVDHKTMKQRRPSTNLNNQFIGQCVVMGTRSMIVNKIGFQKTLKAEDKFTREVVSYSSNRLMEWQSEILPYYAQLLLMYEEGGYYPPNFTHCESKYGMCAFKSVCESDQGMREEEIKNTFYVGEKWDPKNS